MKKIDLHLHSVVKSFFGCTLLEDAILIGAQHILESIDCMLLSLREFNFQLRKVFLLGKCYSSSNLIAKKMLASGMSVSSDSFQFDSHLSFDQQYRKYIDNFVQQTLVKINFEKYTKLIILDDGGYLIRAIQQRFPSPVKLVGIEQTSAGSHSLRSISASFPIINVGRSHAKLAYEAPLIINSFITSLQSKVDFDKYRDLNVLIIGMGPIGRALYRFLKSERFSDLHTFDIIQDQESRRIPLIQQADLIVGCTGSTSISFDSYRYLKKGVILASLSSSDREFDGHRFRQLFRQSDDPFKTYTKNDITLLHAGFPINFWGAPNNMPLEDIQITTALLMAGILQGVLSDSLNNGLNPLDKEIESKIIQEYQCIKQARRYQEVS